MNKLWTRASRTWTTLQELKGDSEILKQIDDAEALLRSLRKALS